MNYEYYSSLAMVTSVVVYLLALIAHAAEWGAARSLGADTTSERRLVGAGAGGGAKAPGNPSSDPVTGGPGHERSQRVEMFGRMGLMLTVIGFGCSLLGVVLRGVAGQRAPWGNMYEFVTACLVFVVAGYLVVAIKFGQRWLGLFVTLLATIANGLAVTVFYVAVAPLVPALHSVWFIIHIVAAALAGAAFNIGGLASILFLFKQRSEARGAGGGYLARMPSSQRIDLLSYRMHAFAFPVWTFAVAAGAVWAQYAWGRPWGWDPKETWALITWVIYACYLHARSTAGWKGTRATIIAIIGLVSFWFNFIGVNLLVSGLHSYAGI
ncbi:MAG: c-type cytochrome biogenesis protein CcsB [Propionibacteriaceae bacterium]